MNDDLWRRDEIESPCVKICVLHPVEKICIGCHRSGAEIGAWSLMTPEARQAIMAELPSRASKLVQRRGGRAGRREG
ncbi:MAG: DUF1289 domain-containing protein [Gemmobacter sp.]|jgi:predicted Fe-S protein YdhL (DUF1289 family)|nr:DUF1289 domain-containing protein [Gemmobacter sp.]